MEQKNIPHPHVRSYPQKLRFFPRSFFLGKSTAKQGVYRVIKPFCTPAVYSSRARNSVYKFATHGHTPEISLYSPILEAFTIWSMF